jgi:hypothetical protein
VTTEAEDRRRSSDVLLVVLLVVAGLVLAGVWRLIVPATADLGDEQETQAAVDGTLALLQTAAGVLTGLAVLIRPGPRPAWRTLLVLPASVVAGAVSWQLGDLLGTPALTAIGAAFVWPVATAITIFVGAMLPGTSRQLELAGRDRRGPFDGTGDLPEEYRGYIDFEDDEFRRDERSGPSGPS